MVHDLILKSHFTNVKFSWNKILWTLKMVWSPFLYTKFSVYIYRDFYVALT